MKVKEKSDKYYINKYHLSEDQLADYKKKRAEIDDPDLIIEDLIEPEISLRRIQGRGFTEIYEKLDYLKKTEEEYLKVISFYEKNHPEMKIVRLDATQPIEKTAEIIWSYIKEMPIIKA